MCVIFSVNRVCNQYNHVIDVITCVILVVGFNLVSCYFQIFLNHKGIIISRRIDLQLLQNI